MTFKQTLYSEYICPLRTIKLYSEHYKTIVRLSVPDYACTGQKKYGLGGSRNYGQNGAKMCGQIFQKILENSTDI